MIASNSPYEDIKRSFLCEDDMSKELGEGGITLAFAGYYLSERGEYEACKKFFNPSSDPMSRAEKMDLLRASYLDARHMAELHGTHMFGVFYCVLLPDGKHIRTGQYAIMVKE